MGFLEVFTEDASSAFCARNVGVGGCVDCGIGSLAQDTPTHPTLLHLPIRSVLKSSRVFSLPKFVFALSRILAHNFSRSLVTLPLAIPSLQPNPQGKKKT